MRWFFKTVLIEGLLLTTPALAQWDPTAGGKGTSFMLYQCGNTCSTPLGEEPALQDDPTLMSYMEWYDDSTNRLDPAGNIYRTVRQTGQNRLQEMLSISTNNPYGQNEVEITGEFRQFDPSGDDAGYPNGRGWYIPTNGLVDGGGNFSFYPVNGAYIQAAWTLSPQVVTNITNMIDDIIAARGSRGQSFSSILLHLQFIDNAASYCLGNANYSLVTDQNFAIFKQVREIIKSELAAKGSGIVLVSDLDAEAAAYPASGIFYTGLHGYNCAAYNGTWSGANPATIQYLLDQWSRYLALPDVGTGGEYSIGFSTYGDITAMLNAFYANGLRVPQTLGFDVYAGETAPSGWVSYVNSIKAAYYGSSVPLYGVRIMETEYADFAVPINEQWVTGTNSLPAAINTGAQFKVLGINQWQTTDYFPGVADIFDHTAIAASMNPVAFAYGSK